jgi:hypothetical protein
MSTPVANYFQPAIILAMNLFKAKALLGGSTKSMAEALQISDRGIYQRWTKGEYRQDQIDRIVGAAVRVGFLKLNKSANKRLEKIEREKGAKRTV